MGPFVLDEEVFATFHHNPTVRELPKAAQTKDAKYVMVMIGDDVPPPPGTGAHCTDGAALDVHHLEGVCDQGGCQCARLMGMLVRAVSEDLGVFYC